MWGNFNLQQGGWYQVGATLPNFTAENSFTLNSNNGSTASVQFIRALGGDGSALTPYKLI